MDEEQVLAACLNCSWIGPKTALEHDFDDNLICPVCGSTRVYTYIDNSDIDDSTELDIELEI